MRRYSDSIDPESIAAARSKLADWRDPETRYTSSGPVKILEARDIPMDPPPRSPAVPQCSHMNVHGRSTFVLSNTSLSGAITRRCSKCKVVQVMP